MWLCGDCAVIPKRLAASKKNNNSDYAAIVLRLRGDCAAITHRLHGDYAAIARRLRGDFGRLRGTFASVA
jgi:hypothetical protein